MSEKFEATDEGVPTDDPVRHSTQYSVLIPGDLAGFKTHDVRKIVLTIQYRQLVLFAPYSARSPCPSR